MQLMNFQPKLHMWNLIFFFITTEIKFDILHHLVLKGFDRSYQWIWLMQILNVPWPNGAHKEL
jgi:hypothetical protein